LPKETAIPASPATPRPVAIHRFVFLVGFMGCGKTTVGKLLAGRLGWGFFDLDEQIEQRLGRTIPQIFAEQGEPYFREVELSILEGFLAQAGERPTVAALGGGTIAQPENLARIRAHGGISIWLRCPLEELRRRCSTLTNRPLFRDAASFEQLYQQRLPYYQQADFAVDVGDRSPSGAVEDILALGVLK